MFHLGERAMFVNPRRSSTLIDEDFVGKIKGLVAAAASGTEAHKVPNKVAEVYRYGFS